MSTPARRPSVVFFLVALPLAALSCTAAREQRAAMPPPAATTSLSPRVEAPPSGPTLDQWAGVYSSTSDVGGFTGTVLSLKHALVGTGLTYRMRFYTDKAVVGSIEQEELRGTSLVVAETLYLPRASGFYDEGKPRLSASIDRYTLRKINGHTVLMHDDALRAFEKENRLYDYGILIKVSDAVETLVDLTKAEHRSIKTLYADPGKPWQDPFVHGPNARRRENACPAQPGRRPPGCS